MGYRNDQWYTLNKESSGESLRSRTRTASGWNISADNPLFRWPDRAIRTNDNDGYQTTYLKRGYIRSIPFAQGDTDYIMKKCQFQFNPRVINQSVSMNTAAYNFLLQNPEDFNQPMPTSVNFGFELMFDRSMEVNNPALGFDRFNEANPWEKSDPSQIGVLADLQAFFNVIGQGLSASQLDYVTRVFQDRAQQLPDGVRYQGGGNSTALPVGEGGSIDLNVNIGNSAFLLPMPVRVVFSSLYVVEGFVQNTAVSFTKFNTNMVPMQCFLTVSMEAKYIGFAKKDTYLTYTLEQAADAAEQTLQEETNRVSGYQQALENAAGVVEMKLTPKVTRIRSNTWPTQSSSMSTSVEDEDYEYELWWRLPSVNKDIQDDVAKLMDDGSNISINVYPTLSLYKTNNGWRPTSQIPSGSVQSVFKNQVAAGTKIFGISGGGWEEAVAESDKWYKFSRASRSDVKGNDTTIDYDPDGNDTFIAHYYVNITCIVDGVVISGFADQYFLLTSLTNDGLFRRVNVIWPQSQSLGDDSGSNSGVVPASNTATNPPQAGETSDVGSSNNRSIFNRTRVSG